MTEAEMDDINDRISNLFEGRTLDEVATILKIQLAMLVTQGSKSADEAADFLADISDEVEDIVQSFDFSAMSDEGSPHS